MKYRATILIALLCLIAIHLPAQNILLGEKDTSKVDPKLTPTQVYVNEEIRMMDSMLNIWYVKNEVQKHNSVLSKLREDTFARDNSDSLMCKRLKQIVTAVPLAYNDRVKRFIELYSVQRQRSSSVIVGLAQYYYPWMKEIFDKYDVPEELVYITIIESALNPLAVSPVGATGIWQFMYGTGKLYGLEVNTFVDDRRDPYKATDAAARHFRDLYNIFKDWGLAISAYNCGAGNVRKAIQRSGGKTDFWGVCPYLPKETQNYFPAFIGALYMMNYHHLYGIEPIKISIPGDVDTVMVDKPIFFEQISKVLDISMDEIKTLNPQYKKYMIPAYTEQCPLRLRSADLIRFIAMKDSIPKYNYDEYFNVVKETPQTEVVQTTPNKYHYVKKGETLGRIASRYGVSVSQLKSLNHIHSNYLRVGQKLLVKKGTTIVKNVPATASDSNAIKDSTTMVKDSSLVKKDTVVSPAQKPVVTPAPAKPAPAKPAYTTHTVKKGETLSSIAKKYHKSQSELAKYNHIKNVNSIQIGQKIKIPK
ncbi:MAG: LysM peptidoglycan-binding domain-containing protein [Bacteroidales bacterium]|nr:LysM peptidoglycan-binding domain-containing protein [Bacteroidales bacterium]